MFSLQPFSAVGRLYALYLNLDVYLSEKYSIKARESARIRFQSFGCLPIPTTSRMFNFNSNGNGGVSKTAPGRQQRRPQPRAAVAGTAVAAGIAGPPRNCAARAMNGQQGMPLPGPMQVSPGMPGQDCVETMAANLSLPPGGGAQLLRTTHYPPVGVESPTGQPEQEDLTR